MRLSGWMGLLIGGLLLTGQNLAHAQIPLYTEGAVAKKVPGHNLVIITPDKSPSRMYREQQAQRAALRQSSGSQTNSVTVDNNNTVVINNNVQPFAPDDFITGVYQVQTPRYWRRQYSMGYTFTGPYGFYRPYSSRYYRY